VRFSGLELFLDDERVAYTRNLRRQVQRPVLHPRNPVLRREHPWETSHVAMYGNVLHDAERGRFRMWYNAFGPSYYDQQMLAYAESDDGIEWEKPRLDVRTWPGSRRTNILFGPEANVHGPGVIENPDQSDPERRWLLLFDSYPKFRPDAAERGIFGRWSYTAESPDGLRWSPEKGRPAFEGKADSAQCVLWDPAVRRFRAYSRLTTVDAFGQRIRTFRRLESRDFLKWSAPVEAFRPDEEDGAPDTQLQQLSVSLYDGIYIGFLTLFRISQYVIVPDGSAIDEGTQVDHTQLLTSRDGLHFHRVADRAHFLDPAPTGFGATGYRLAPHVLVHGDEVRIYLSSNRRKGGRWSGLEIGLATLVKDRFAALLPERMREAGLVELKPLEYGRRPLRLNAAVGKAGWVRPEVADMGGNAIEGFTRAEAAPLTGDAAAHDVQWQKRGRTYGLGALPAVARGKPVRLRFWLEQAKIFALRSGE